MSQTSLKYTESAHIGEELMDDSALELKRRCSTVHKMVSNQMFTLEEALEAYDVPMTAYFNFIAGNTFYEISSGIKGKNEKLTEIATMSIVIKLMDKVDPLEKNFKLILTKLHEYLDKLEEKYAEDVK